MLCAMQCWLSKCIQREITLLRVENEYIVTHVKIDGIFLSLLQVSLCLEWT